MESEGDAGEAKERKGKKKDSYITPVHRKTTAPRKKKKDKS